MGDYEYRLTRIDYGCLLATAIFFDVTQGLLSLIPFLGLILSFLVSIFAFLTFWLWLTLKNIGFFDKGLRKIAVWAIGPLIEAFLGFLPVYSVMIILTYYIVKVDDELDRKNILTKQQQEILGGYIYKNLK